MTKEEILSELKLFINQDKLSEAVELDFHIRLGALIGKLNALIKKIEN